VAVSNVDKKSVTSEEPVRLCNYTDVYYNDVITDRLSLMEATASQEQIRHFGLRAGDVLITKDSETPEDIGVPAFVQQSIQRGVCGYHLAIVRARPDRLMPKYLFWALQASGARAELSSAATGVTRFGLRAGSIRDLKISAPSLEPQRRVADFLDAEITRINDLIDRKLTLVARVEERFRTWARIVLTGTNDPEPKRGVNGQVWLPETPSSWTPRKLSRHFTVGSGTTPSTGSPRYFGGGIPWVNTGDLHDGLVTQESRSVTHQALQDYPALRMFPAGSIVMAMYGATIGKLGVLAEPSTVNQACCVLAQPLGMEPEFVFHWLFAFRHEIVSLGSGGGQRNISQETIRGLRIPAPGVSRQREIVSSLDAEQRQVRAVTDALDRQIALLKERRQALITAAVTGELDVTTGAA
jgi:type I restriction enzyme S subunit